MKNKIACLKEERMLVLNMVQEGKISVDEATRLLDNLRPNHNFNEYGDSESVFHKKINTISENVEELSKDIGDKLACMFKKFEPHAKSATKKVVEKTISVMNNISKALEESDSQLQNQNSQDVLDSYNDN